MAINQRSRLGIVVLAILVIIAAYLAIAYNGLVKDEENVKLNWGNLQNAYQRRVDLTPGLVSVVKGSTDYEKQTLEQLAAARAKAQQVTLSASNASSDNYSRQEQAQAEMVGSMNRVIGLIEKYPDLQSTKSFVDLQAQLVGTERRIKVSRDDFNGAVAQYNKSVRKFPSNVAASLFSFKPKEGFQSDAGAATAPEVKF
ncbi:MAG TPA: LemA family protein [Puia sp.]|nr:LemA family protein [Puia sp.]